MAHRVGSSVSCIGASPSSFQSKRASQLNLKLSQALFNHQLYDMQQQRSIKAKVLELCRTTCGTKLKERPRKRQRLVFAISGNNTSEELNVDDPELEKHHSSVELAEDNPTTSSNIDDSFGKPGFVSFYNRLPKGEDESLPAGPEKTGNSLLWFVAPTVLIASSVFPSLYLRKKLSTIFEDSLLTGQWENFEAAGGLSFLIRGGEDVVKKEQSRRLKSNRFIDCTN